MKNRIDSRALELFLAVADSLSFRQAAEVLHISQPPLSRAIREFEARLGTALFERDTQRVALTPAGQALLPYARGVERMLREAQARLQAMQAAGPRLLRLGLTSAVELPWMRELPRLLQGQGIEARLASDSSPRLVRQVLAGRLDAAVIALPTNTQGGLLDALDRLPMRVALPAAHRLAKRRMLSLAELAAEPLYWFARARQPAFHDHCQRVFAQHGYAPPRRAEPTDHHVLLAEVAAGGGVALLPESFAGLRHPGVVYRRLREGEALAVGVGLLTHADRPGERELLLKLLRPYTRS